VVEKTKQTTAKMVEMPHDIEKYVLLEFVLSVAYQQQISHYNIHTNIEVLFSVEADIATQPVHLAMRTFTLRSQY